MRKIEVVPYDPNWPQLFEKEALLIQKALGDNCIAVHHIGSTSVPGLSAKPVIDILPVVKEITKVDVKAMENLGYEYKGENGMAFRRYFQKGGHQRTHHVHVFEEGDPEVSRHVKFRNYLRAHPEDALTYATLKLDLASKHPNDILAYVSGKEAFVAGIETMDGYEGYRMVQALTDREWAAVHALTKQDPINQGKEHIHFVFYKNAAIIGYAHLQLEKKGKAHLIQLVMDTQYRNSDFEKLFRKQLERWITHQGLTQFQ